MKKLTIGHYFLALIIAIGFILLIGLSACKVKTKDVAKSDTHSSFSQTDKVSKDTTAQTVETQQTTTVEKTDSLITVPAATATGAGSVDSIASGHPLIVTADGIIFSTTIVDGKVKTNVQVPAKTIPVHKTKTTTTNSSKQTTANGKTQAEKNTKASTNQTTVTKKQQTTSDFAGNVKLGILLIIICVIAGLIIYWRLKANQII